VDNGRENPEYPSPGQVPEYAVLKPSIHRTSSLITTATEFNKFYKDNKNMGSTESGPLIPDF
jgi:hypothetical protein